MFSGTQHLSNCCRLNCFPDDEPQRLSRSSDAIGNVTIRFALCDFPYRCSIDTNPLSWAVFEILSLKHIQFATFTTTPPVAINTVLRYRAPMVNKNKCIIVRKPFVLLLAEVSLGVSAASVGWGVTPLASFATAPFCKSSSVSPTLQLHNKFITIIVTIQCLRSLYFLRNGLL